MLKETFVLDRIEELMQKHKFSRYRLAKNSGLLQSYISTMFTRRSTPDLYTLDRICHGFGITLADFFADDDNKLNITEEKKFFLNTWSSLNDANKQQVFIYMQSLIDSKNSET